MDNNNVGNHNNTDTIDGVDDWEIQHASLLGDEVDNDLTEISTADCNAIKDQDVVTIKAKDVVTDVADINNTVLIAHDSAGIFILIAHDSAGISTDIGDSMGSSTNNTISTFDLQEDRGYNKKDCDTNKRFRLHLQSINNDGQQHEDNSNSHHTSLGNTKSLLRDVKVKPRWLPNGF